MRGFLCLASLGAMNGRVLAAALVGLVLAPGPVAVVASPASAAEVVPCPHETLSPPPQRPPRPKPPALDPADARVGGDALATTGLAIPSGAATPPKLTASTWLVADLDTGEVLGACDAHGYQTPASVQKVLLAATMIPKLDPEQVVRVTREDLDIERGSSSVGLLDGGKYPIETLWYGLLLNSGNDAANVLARIGGGDKGRAGGVAMMNAEARHLGALQTHAVTPSGLDGTGQFTSAYDLVLIARAAFGLPDFRKYVAAHSAKIPPQPPKDTRGFQIQNDNGLLKKYPGALGGKSGFTTLARHSFVGAAKRGDRTLVAAVLGAEAQPIRASEQTGKLLDWGFALRGGASVGRLVEPGELDPAPTPTEDRALAAQGAAAPSDGVPGSSSAAVIGMTVAVVAVVLVMLLAATRRRAVVRARRAALAERRAALAGGAVRTRPDAARGGGIPPPAGRGYRPERGRGPAARRGVGPEVDRRGAAGRDDGGERLYRRPADLESPAPPRPPAGPRPARGPGAPDDHYPPPAPAGRGAPSGRGVSDGRYPPPTAGRGAPSGRPRSDERYPPPERRPPAQRRGPAAPDVYRPRRPDDR